MPDLLWTFDILVEYNMSNPNESLGGKYIQNGDIQILAKMQSVILQDSIYAHLTTFDQINDSNDGNQCCLFLNQRGVLSCFQAPNYACSINRGIALSERSQKSQEGSELVSQVGVNKALQV